MISLKDAVHGKPSFEKVAEYELPKEVSSWNEEILKQFYSDVNYLPKEIKIDIVVDSIDENKGYAKGSIVAFSGDNKINFPIIVKDYMLSPFDTFVDQIDGKYVYHAANLRNIKKALAAEASGTLENYWGKGDPRPGTKPIAGIYPKKSISIHDANIEQIYPPFSKMSSWPFLAKKEDLEKLAIQMEAEPDVSASFVDNSGDLLGNIIDLTDANSNYKRVVADDHKEGDLDLNNVVKAKQMVTAIDSEMLDPDDLKPMSPPSVCELRLYCYPTMEDFMESGDNMAERFNATKVGKAITGVLLDCKGAGDFGEDGCIAMAPVSDSTVDEKNMAVRNKRPQIFISSCGCYYSIFNDYSKTGIGFYGTRTLNAPGVVEKVIGLLSEKTTSDFVNQNKENKRDGSDKLFRPIEDMTQGLNESGGFWEQGNRWDVGLLVIYGSGDAWECMKFNGNFRKYKVNDSDVFVSEDVAIIPANIASIQKVKSVEDPIYKMVVGRAKSIYLVPEGSLFINASYMKKIQEDSFMTPAKSIQQTYDEAAIKKVALYVAHGEESLGYKITGQPFADLEKIAGASGKILSSTETVGALRVLGMKKTAAVEAMKVAMNRYADPDRNDKNVIIYGVNDDYINSGIFDGREKTARINKLLKEYAYSLRRDLVKEASALDDPEAVDVVLSLNFINEDSIAGYVENIQEMKRISADLSKMLIASRMGLTDIDESALKKSIQGLNEVINGLESLKMATSDKGE